MQEDHSSTAQSEAQPKSPKPGIYERFENKAKTFKAALQMLVGVGMLVGLVWYLVSHLDDSLLSIQRGVFNVAGVGLAVGAVIELGYTFFTPGPDEAINPALLAVSAALIIKLGQDTDGLDWNDGLTTLLLTVALVTLFTLQHYLLPGSDDSASARPKR